MRGPGSSAVVAQLAIVDVGVIMLPLKHGNGSLRIVREYTHMGMRRTPHMCLANETQSRASKTFQEFTKIRAKIIQCPQLARNTRSQLGNVFMFARLFYNSGTWSRMTSKAHAPLE